MNSPNKRTRIVAKLCPAVVGIFCLVAICLLAGCTVIPKPFEAPTASFDGGEQNSGFLGSLPDHDGVITPHARDRYNELVKTFGTRFQPPLTLDAGVSAYTNGTFRIDPEHLVKFATMNRWRRERPPP